MVETFNMGTYTSVHLGVKLKVHDSPVSNLMFLTELPVHDIKALVR